MTKAAEKGVRKVVSSQAAKLAAALGLPKPDAGAAAPAEQACDGNVSLACASALVEDLGLARFDRLRASVAAEIAGYLADPAATSEQAADTCVGAPEDEKSRRRCLAYAGLETLRLLDEARGIQAGRPGRLAELAILITSAQSRLADAEARAAGLARRIDNLGEQRQALISELWVLLQARARLDDAAVDPRAVVLAFARSFDVGRRPFLQAADRQQMLKLGAFNDREEQAVRARYAIADGLLQTVASAAASGLKPQDAAGFLSAVGITTLGISEAVR